MVNIQIQRTPPPLNAWSDDHLNPPLSMHVQDGHSLQWGQILDITSLSFFSFLASNLVGSLPKVEWGEWVPSFKFQTRQVSWFRVGPAVIWMVA